MGSCRAHLLDSSYSVDLYVLKSPFLHDVSHLFYLVVDTSNLKTDLQIMLDVLGSDPTETACEAECHKILQQGHVLNYGCPLVCHA